MNSFTHHSRVSVLAACTVSLIGAACAHADDLPTLSDTLPKDRVAIRVIAPDSSSIAIEDILNIEVLIAPDSRWIMGPKPEVRERFADGWVTVDEIMFRLGKPKMKTYLTFSTQNGDALIATGEIERDAKQRITFHIDANPTDFGIDLANGPATVAPEELAGRVLDADGKPIEGATVTFSPGDDKALPFPDAIKPLTTDPDGMFRVPAFANTHYIAIHIDKPGFARRWLTDVPVGKSFSVRLHDKTRAVGDLKLPDGLPAANATIKFVTSRATTRTRMGNRIDGLNQIVKTDANGHYDVALEPGSYEVNISATAGQSDQLKDWTIKLNETVSIPAELNDGYTVGLRAIDEITGKPVAHARFGIMDSQPGARWVREGTQVESDGDGRVKWEHLPKGQSLIFVAAEGYTQWWIGDAPSDQRSGRNIDHLRVDVRKDLGELVVKMRPGVSVTGVVVSPEGTPVGGLMVNIGGLSTGDSRYSRTTDANGKFNILFPNLKQRMNGYVDDEARYAVVVFDPKGRWTNAISSPLLCKPGETNDVKLTMASGPSVRGQVVDPDGKPVVGIEVEAVCDDGMDAMYFNPRAVTDANGNFDLGPMRAGHYKIQADTYFGVNIATIANPPPVEIDLDSDGKPRDIQIIYDGPKPPPVPTSYFNQFGNRRVAKE